MCMSAICASRAKSSPLRGASKTTRNGLIPYPKYRSVSFFHQITDKLRDSNFILAVGGRRERTPVDAGLEDDHRVDAGRVRWHVSGSGRDRSDEKQSHMLRQNPAHTIPMMVSTDKMGWWVLAWEIVLLLA